MEDLHEWGTRLEVLEDVKEKEIVFADILRVLQMPGGTDGAKSLAAQLVSKHAPTFPHHEDAAIDALINLSQGGDGKQSQSVRIHAILGLVTFVKGQTTISLPLHEKLGQFVHATLARETSGVLLRHLTSLQKLLTPAPTAPVASAPSSSLTTAAVPSSPAKPEPRRECIPPSPYLYIKGFQLGTELGKLLAYFQNVDPTLTLSKIHLNKASKHHHNAFLNCTTIDKARQVIEYASTHPFDNRNLVALFARGPQVASVVFHLASSYPTPPNDLAEVWPDVKSELQRLKATYWSTTVGKAKFDSMDFVKMLVTKGLTVRGQKIWIVYDMDEQAKAHDAHTKRPAAPPPRGIDTTPFSFRSIAHFAG
ncbi:hypothetical protein H310_12250 [Aphanomyces invadans]|uniref:Uncharacterized protein n=1 Tax=Aphanomyces invadans TaxID=157072 RepID=A0A024TJZ8_9STRA|nr:hypothetical protein H310_12250 [Aphanomyces invadans]ETV93906.1 hypothetical protein H310_12250 [Aphanomyces invadans]|eukprot:XP_008877466.1 hypothetical protein H310_12250 [Aphanomyces invadans]